MVSVLLSKLSISYGYSINTLMSYVCLILQIVSKFIYHIQLISLMLEREEYINNKCLKVKQDLSLSHAGTVWDGALVLAYYLQKNQEFSQRFLSGRSIIELGSGTGILGLACSTFQAENLLLTDLPEYISILDDNIKMNIGTDGKVYGCLIAAAPLIWGKPEHMSAIDKIDTIVGSQLAYDEGCITDLIKTITHFYQVNKDLKVIISYQKYQNPSRNLATRLQKQFSAKKFIEVPYSNMHETYRDSYIGILYIE